MFKLLYSCVNFTCQQDNAQNSSSQASTVCELRNSRYTSRVQKRQKNQRSNYQRPLDHRKKEIPEKNIHFCFINYAKPLTVWITTNCGEFLKGWEYLTSKKHVCMKRRTVRSRLGTMERFKTGKAVKAVYCHTAYLTSVWIHHAKCQVGYSTS